MPAVAEVCGRRDGVQRVERDQRCGAEAAGLSAMRRPASAGRHHRRPVSRARGAGASVRRWDCAAHAGSEPVHPLGAGERLPILFARLAAAGLGEAGASTIGDVTSCPGAESCKLAVTQSRGLGRLLTDTLRAARSRAGRRGARHQDQRLSERLRSAPHRDAWLSGQRAQGRGRAVPQYFVMVGGAATTDGATFARLAAKIPRVGSAPPSSGCSMVPPRAHRGRNPARFFGRARSPT